MVIKQIVIFAFLLLFALGSHTARAAFVAFESGQVRPIAQSPDGNKLYVVNTPDNHLEIFNVNNGSLTHAESVAVGLEPVSVAALSNDQVWVVNYLSDSISIIDVSVTPARIIKTLLVGDEPADIVFAGTNGNRAFITTAHRGQNSPYNDPSNPGELMTPGIGRADVWVFDATNTGSSLGGDPVVIVTLFGDTPKALAVSPDGSTVYAAVFKSGNQTTTLHEEVVCDSTQPVPCLVKLGEQLSIGRLPPPNADIDGAQQPEVGLIVKYNSSQWLDELNRDWSRMVRFNLPDKDVFAIDADALVPVETTSFANVGTVLFNMAVNPKSGKIYVANTEAINEVRFEGPGTISTTVQGHLHETRITIIDPATGDVNPVHLNKHINYDVTPAPAGVSGNSLAIPKGIAVTADGSMLYVVAKGSAKVGVFDVTKLENNSFSPDAASHITLSAGGPDGILLDELNKRLYVTTRFDNALSVIDTESGSEISHIGLHNPEPVSVITGRQFLYDAKYTSSNGEASCASCHIEGDKDELAWDLGNPDGSVVNNLNPFTFVVTSPVFHPMKGPMTTQTLRGMANHGPMHWRGDRSGANIGGDALDEALAFKEFNVAFEGLLGRTAPLAAEEMQAFSDFILQVIPPPNPIRALDNSLTPDQQAGSDFYFGPFLSDTLFNCNGCHQLAPASGFFGANGNSTFEGATQEQKIPQLRNLYEKVGMFGMPDIPFNIRGDNEHTGDQIRGFGYSHDGSIDTLDRFFRSIVFNFSLTSTPEDILRKQVAQFLFAYDSNLKPIVGQQITLSGAGSAVVLSRIDLLTSSALAGDADLIVKMTISGKKRGALMLASGDFQTDRIDAGLMSTADLRNIAQVAGQEVTYTAVPPGSGLRLGIDRDEDTILDGDDNCPINDNPDQLDSDNDGIGNKCDGNLDSLPTIDDEPEDMTNNVNQADSDSGGLSLLFLFAMLLFAGITRVSRSRFQVAYWHYFKRP